MTSPTVPRIEEGRLRILKPLGDGGQGVVYQVAVPESADPLMAYKKYKGEFAGQVDWAALEGLVGLYDGADDESRHWLREHTAWPSGVVTAAGAPCGFLMRLAPDDCFGKLLTSDDTDTLLALEFLLNPPNYLARVGLLVSETDRLAILRDLAQAIQRLHAWGISVGDLSPKNVVFAHGAVPRCFLIDCDAVSRAGLSVLRQVETADWSVPPGEALATPHSDGYKLGLLAVRLLAGDQSNTDLSVIPPSMPELADLARRALTEDPSQRPSPADWVGVLDATIPRASTQIPTVVVAQRPATAATANTGLPSSPVLSPPRPRRSPGRIWALVGAGALALVIFCVGVTSLINSSNEGSTPDPYTPPVANGPVDPVEPGIPEPTQPAEPTPVVTAVNAIDISAVATDPRAVDVARLFDSYFTGINNRQMDAVLILYDPTSVIGKADQQGRATFIHDVSTTTDSQVQITSLVDGGADGGVLTALVRFRSEQQAGFGPRRDPAERCTVWTVTYSLTEPTATQYRILRGPGTSTPC